MLMAILKWGLIILGVLVLLFTGLLFKAAADSRGMTVLLGVENGQLKACPSSPNCVSSDAPLDDSHYIAAIADPGGARWAGLIAVVSAMEGAALVSAEAGYARFTFTTPLMRFVDDVEFHHRPAQGEIAVRSASRVGEGDLNANRNRVEAIRTALE